MIISLNGLDACGKTTQINNIAKKYGDIWTACNPVRLSERIESLSPGLFHEWWFNTSKCEEFCDEIYSSIKKAFSDLKGNAILDKGIATFDARVWATLVIKGLSQRDAYEMLQQKKSQYGICVLEQERILLVKDKVYNHVRDDSDYSHAAAALYKHYQILQGMFLDWLYSIGYFTHRISTSCSIDETTKAIMDSIQWKDRSFSGRSVCTQPEELGLPRKETQQIENILDYVKCLFRNDLIALLVGGSISRKQYIQNWSDIDILLFVRRYSLEQNEQLGRFLRQVDIKTGCTVFSEYEIKNKLLDAKSLYSIYAYNSGRITSLLYGAIPYDLSVTFENLKQKNKMVIPETIHKLKRLLNDSINDSITEKSQKEIFKLTVLVMKVYLINIYNTIPQSYNSVMELFNYLTQVNTIEPNIVTFGHEFSKIKDFSANVISYVSNEKIECKEC